MPCESQTSWTMMSSTILASCYLSLLWYVFFLFSFISFFFLYITLHDDIQMEYLCQASPTAGAPINPPHLPWSVYACNPDDFSWEYVVGHNINVIVPFSWGYTSDKFSSTPCQVLPFLFLHPSITCSNNVFLLTQLTIQEHEELICLAGNLKMEVTK